MCNFKAVVTTEVLHHSETEEIFWKWKPLSRVRFFATPWIIVHGILQARILEKVAFPFSRGSSQSRGQTQVSYIAGRFWAIREVQAIDICKMMQITFVY